MECIPLRCCDRRSRAADFLVKLSNASDAVVTGLLALLKDDSFTFSGFVSDRAAQSLIQLSKKSPKVLPALTQWIEQNEKYVGNGIDVLWELVN